MATRCSWKLQKRLVSGAWDFRGQGWSFSPFPVVSCFVIRGPGFVLDPDSLNKGRISKIYFTLLRLLSVKLGVKTSFFIGIYKGIAPCEINKPVEWQLTGSASEPFPIGRPVCFRLSLSFSVEARCPQSIFILYIQVYLYLIHLISTEAQFVYIPNVWVCVWGGGWLCVYALSIFGSSSAVINVTLQVALYLTLNFHCVCVCVAE